MKFLTAILALSSIPALTLSAQTTPLKPELLLYHPSTALSYDVAAIEPLDPNTAKKALKLSSGTPNSLNPLSVRSYLMDAYGAIYPAQIVGGPDWLARDSYRINAKPSAGLEAELRKMKPGDALNQNRAMLQSLLAERFHLKAHFETRVLPVYELVPAKDGLKITEVPAPSELKPGPSPQRPARCAGLSSGESRETATANGLRVLNACAITMQVLASYISGSAPNEIDPLPVVDHSGFAGYFDIKNFVWAPLSWFGTDNHTAHFLQPTLEERLGIELVRARAPIEVLVIDSIDRPSED